jgi:hypothetical protein
MVSELRDFDLGNCLADLVFIKKIGNSTMWKNMFSSGKEKQSLYKILR